jgi:sugar phosphate permease
MFPIEVVTILARHRLSAHELHMATSPASAPTDIETRTIRKVRTRIIPFIFVLMVIAFLDRINIGFAALTMNKELAITSQQFGFLSGIFFFGHCMPREAPSVLSHYCYCCIF